MGSAKLSSRDVYESEKQVQRICDNFLWLSEILSQIAALKMYSIDYARYNIYEH